MLRRDGVRRAEAERNVANDRLRLAMESGKSVGWEWDLKTNRDTHSSARGRCPHELHSPRLLHLGVVAAMLGFCEELSGQKTSRLISDKRTFPGSVPPDVSLCLFRVLQEALYNGVRHGQAQHFEVRLRGTGNAVHLTVRDDGVRFDVDAASRGLGLGLTSMKERLKLVGGELVIESNRNAAPPFWPARRFGELGAVDNRTDGTGSHSRSLQSGTACRVEHQDVARHGHPEEVDNARLCDALDALRRPASSHDDAVGQTGEPPPGVWAVRRHAEPRRCRHRRRRDSADLGHHERAVTAGLWKRDVGDRQDAVFAIPGEQRRHPVPSHPRRW